MTHVKIETSTTLNGKGVTGAALFILAPIVGGFMIQNEIGRLSRTLRYLPDTTWDTSSIWTIAAATGAAWSIGVVLLLIGRDYSHDVRSAQDHDG